jgi:hypothetical protein
VQQNWFCPCFLFTESPVESPPCLCAGGYLIDLIDSFAIGSSGKQLLTIAKNKDVLQGLNKPVTPGTELVVCGINPNMDIGLKLMYRPPPPGGCTAALAFAAAVACPSQIAHLTPGTLPMARCRTIVVATSSPPPGASPSQPPGATAPNPPLATKSWEGLQLRHLQRQHELCIWQYICRCRAIARGLPGQVCRNSRLRISYIWQPS